MGNSDLKNDQKQDLLQLFEDGDRAEFLGRAFLYAVVGDNCKKDDVVELQPIEEDIQTF